ncbi:hypothetical protein AB8B21_07485 [Tardiphaga sp. 866_E4_N2_1]|uniref:hypothetical protein n=1 Tax=unclassified Tardiphaga TaxID=2631404 RepID=UPI003F227D7B
MNPAVDIGEDEMDVLARFEDRNGLISSADLNHLEARVRQLLADNIPDEDFVLDY